MSETVNSTTADATYILALQQRLAASEEVITAWIMEELPLFKRGTPLGEGVEASGLNPHQFAQLLGVAEETRSVPAVMNYLRYQIARSEKDKAWRYEDVGEQIVAALEERICREALTAAQEAAEGARGSSAMPTKAEERQAWVALTRLYLAALRRCFMYRFRDQSQEV